MNKKTLKDITWIAVIALIYFIVGRLSINILYTPGYIAAIWPAGGIFLSAILLTRKNLRQYLIITLFITDFFVEMMAGSSVALSIWYAFSLAFDAWLSSWLIIRFCSEHITFQKIRDVYIFILTSVIFSNAIASTLAAFGSYILLNVSYWDSWKWWWASDAVGNLLITPLILSWAYTTKSELSKLKTGYIVELIVLFFSMIIVNNLALRFLFGNVTLFSFLNYTTFPFLIWAALRFGIRGVTMSSIILTANALYFTISGKLILSGTASELNTIIIVQLYLAIISITSLFLASIVTEREQTEILLKEKNDEIEAQNEEYLQVNEELNQTIEELNSAKKHAEESDRLKTAFLQNMSHEIRTPMNAIMGFSSLLVNYYDDKPKLEEFSRIIGLSCNDLLEMINDILDIARIESGQESVNNQEFRLKELFAELTPFFTELRKRIKKLEVELDFQPHDPEEFTIFTDKVKLKQIFINLIDNAYKFTEKGKIEAGYKFDSNNKLIFYVTDTGIGIPADKYNTIFERFAQLNQDKKKLFRGTGLGLSIVKGLIDLLKGEIHVESELEKGTAFYFSIPYKIAQTVHNASVMSEENKEYDFTGKTILVIEDDVFNAAYIKEVLSKTGLNILHTEFGQEAVQIATTQPLDMVLMDIRLPDISGYEATRRIRQQKPFLTIIAVTAFASQEDRQKAIVAGCDDYISKPLDRNLLLSKINNLMIK